MQLEYTAPKHVFDAIAALGRTEAVKFSPSNRRVAITSLFRNKISVFDICISASPYGKEISISDVTEISSTYLRQPHGLDFVDDEKVIVANREGDVTIFKLPVGGGSHKLVPLEFIRSGDILKPGAVSIRGKGQNFCEALICNKKGNTVTRHLLRFNGTRSVESSKILLRKWLDLPDGVSVSEPWIAVSNHNTHSVFLYENAVSLNEHSEPDGILRCAHYPHGLQFTLDGRFILVADAGAPYVHIYMKDESGWRGVRSPIKSFRVMSDDDFLRGRTTIHEGGPKGIDIDNSMRTFVTTCEVQPLAFFDLSEILDRISLLQKHGTRNNLDFRETLSAAHERHCEEQRAFEIKYELERQDQSNQAVALLMKSRSWRITAPLRWVSDAARDVFGWSVQFCGMMCENCNWRYRHERKSNAP